MSEINLVTSTESNELYIAYQINPTCGLYHEYIDSVL